MVIADFVARLGVQVNKDEWIEAGGRINGLRLAITAMATYVTARAVGALRTLATEAADYGDAVQDAMEKTGIGSTTMEQFGYAMGGGTAGIEKATASFNKFGIALTEAVKDPAGDAAKALRQMGIAADDPRLLLGDIEALLPDITAGFEGMENITERNALAMKLFGKSGFEMGKTLAELNDKRAEFNEAGGAMTVEERKALAGMKDSAEKTTRMWQLLKTRAIAGIAPQLQEMMNKAVTFFKTHSKEISTFIGNVVSAVSTVVGAFVEVLQTVAAWAEENKIVIGAVWAGLVAAIKMAVLMVKHFGLLVIGAFKGIFWAVGKVIDFFGWLIGLVVDFYDWLVMAKDMFAVGFSKAFTTLGEAFSSFADWLKAPFVVVFDFISQAWDAVFSKVEAAWETIKGWIDEIADVVDIGLDGETSSVTNMKERQKKVDANNAVRDAKKLFSQGKSEEEVRKTLTNIYENPALATNVVDNLKRAGQTINQAPVTITIQGDATPGNTEKLRQVITEVQESFIRNAATALVQ